MAILGLNKVYNSPFNLNYSHKEIANEKRCQIALGGNSIPSSNKIGKPWCSK